MAFLSVTPLDLQRRVFDAEPVFELVGNGVDEYVARAALRHNEMHSQSRLRRAQWPDMQVMDTCDAGLLCEPTRNGAFVDLFRHTVEA